MAINFLSGGFSDPALYYFAFIINTFMYKTVMATRNFKFSMFNNKL